MTLKAEIAPLCFADHFDLISIIYASFQESLCNFVAPCPHIIRIKFHQNQTWPNGEETI